MNNIPSIDQFLQDVDTEKTIDREKAMSEITAVTLLESVTDAKSGLSDESQKSLDKLLQNSEKFEFEAIYELFDKAGKKEQLLTSINENVNKVRIDYIKTHIQAMPVDKKEIVLSNFPALKEI